MSDNNKKIPIVDQFPNNMYEQYKYAKSLLNKGNKITQEEIDLVLNWALVGVECKYPPALCLLAKMYGDGVGVPKDAEKQDECYTLAYTFYKSCGFVGDIETLRSLATTFEFVKRKLLHACELYVLGATGDNSDAQCQYRAGTLFYNSTIGLSGYGDFASIPLEQRRQFAVFCFTEASKQNHLDATTLLAELYELGRCGLSVNKKTASELYAKAAELYKAEIERYKKANDTGMLTVAQMQYDNCSQKAKELAPRVAPTTKPSSTTTSTSTTSQSRTTTSTSNEHRSVFKSAKFWWGIAFFVLMVIYFFDQTLPYVNSGLQNSDADMYAYFPLFLFAVIGIVLVIMSVAQSKDSSSTSSSTSSSKTTSSYSSSTSSSGNKTRASATSSTSTSTKAKKWKLYIYGVGYGVNYEIEEGNFSRLDIIRNGMNTGYEFSHYDGSIYDEKGKEIARLVGYKQTWGEYDTLKSGSVNYYSDYNGEQLFHRWEVVEDK